LSLKSKVLAIAATLALVGGVGLAGAITAGAASAATPSCGPLCADPFSFQFGTHKTPNYVLDVYKQGDKVGQKIILFRASNDDPAEDFDASFQGTVSDFFAAGLVSSAVDLHYGGQCEMEAVTTPVLAAPAAPTVTQSLTGGHVANGTYYVEVTYVNANGQTVASPPTKVVTTGLNLSTITVSPPAAEGNATGWNAYIATSPGGPYTLQQTSPTTIGSNLLLTATPTTTGVIPPATNGATTAPVSGCTGYYPDLYAWELQYAPFGVDSGLCVGLATTAVSGEGVTLQPCGTTARTVWITDTVNAAGWKDNYVPVINGSDTNFSQPFVLDYPHNSVPTDGSPSTTRPQLYVDNLTGFTNGSILDETGIIDTQEWGADFGELP
jgi:hypothetical protein